ncbi:spore cortex biosynthesis protein YabQ [Bacillus sp. NPDC077027]|uniref:spore cortex biosynthesis protein YabQ n=1 Tax=Bacillus sp. NPDC077027 TaxID=3390548 RepID=UPI003D051187
MTLTVQFYTMLSMAAMGIWLGASLDTYKLFVKREKTAKWLLAVHDVLFWMVQGLLFFYVLLITNKGEFRLYIFLAVALGFSMYQALMKRIYMKLLMITMICIQKTIYVIKRLMMSVVLQPIRWLITLILSAVLALLQSILRLFRFIFQLLLKILYMVCYPLIFFIKITIVNRIPEKWRKAVVLFFSKGAGIFQRIKKLSRTIKTKWKQFWTK